MNKYIKFSSPVVFLLSLILILILKTVPSGKLWKNYSVISVPVNTEDSIVQNAIQKAGIKNAVTLSGQYIPVSLSQDSIEISMLRLNYTGSEYAYLTKRNAMFFDKSNTYRLYYIPNNYSSETSTLVKLLESQGIQCIKDSSADYPWILPFIALLLAGMLFLFVKHKLPFVCGSILPLVFLYSNPFYPVAMATCVVLLCLFFISNVWRRRGAVTSLISRYSIPAMLGISFLCAFSSSLATGFLFILSAFGTVSALMSCMIFEDYLRNRKPFVPVYIRSAKRVSLFAGKAFTSMSIVSGTALLFIILIFVTSSNSISTTSSSKLLFPSFSRSADSSLPQMEEFYKWNWNVRTFPYKSLNSNSSNNENQVSFKSYVENADTGIITEENVTLTYDDSFKRDVYDGIDLLQFDAVEKIMKSENSDFSGGYSAASSFQINLFGIIMSFICLCILLFIYISIIIRKGITK